MKHNLALLVIAFASMAFLLACGDDEPGADFNTSVIAINEGSFSAGNGSLSSYDINTETVRQNLYEAGGIIQSAITFDNELFIIVNNSNKLDILDPESFMIIATINEGLDNPIDFAAVGNLGFVSCWGNISTAFSAEPDSYIGIINLSTNTLIDSIKMTTRPQDLLALNGRIYVANEGGSVVSVINPDDLSVSEISTSTGPSALVADKDNDIWVLCTSGELIEIDIDSRTITDNKLTGLTTTGFNEKFVINEVGDAVYFLGGGNDSFTGQTNVFKVSLTESPLVATTFVNGGFALYGVAVNPDNGDVYIGDNNAFQSTGTGFRYDRDGSLLGQFATGVGPSSFIFR